MKAKVGVLAVFFLALLIVWTGVTSAQDEEKPKLLEYTVIGQTANLRSGPSTNNAVVGSVSNGDVIFIYDEESETTGWYRVYREGEDDAYIADFLVERAPMRFYPVEQEPIVTLEGRGKQITDVVELPASAYRIDASIQDNAFILKSITLDGDCDDDSIFNELDFDRNRLEISALFVSSGCSFIFEVDNVDGNWSLEIRNVLDEEFFLESVLIVETGTSMSGRGRQVTMPTLLSEGIWTITAVVRDQAFIMRPQVLLGDCSSSSVFNELDFDATTLELSTVYRVDEEDGCAVFWETYNVEGEWTVTFEKLR